MTDEELTILRNKLIELRNECCLGEEFDTNGAVLLSHTIRWMSFKLDHRPYELPTD